MEKDLHVDIVEQEVLNTLSQQINQDFKIYNSENPSIPSIIVEKGHVTGLFITRLTKLAECEPLKILPASIEQFQYLTHLYLEGNELETIPPSIGNLRNLEVIDLSNNKISQIPESITNLTKLHQIDLSFTLIEEFPAWLIKFIDKNHLTIILRKRTKTNSRDEAAEDLEDYWRHFADYPY
jgi:Leucine-rich repeat (LRR) protein